MTPDQWQEIRAQHEQQGISKSTLAKIHGVTRQAIQQRAHKEKWITPLAPPLSPLAPLQEEQEVTPVAIATSLLQKIAEWAEGDLEPKDIKILMDALSQVHKINLTSPSDKPTVSGIAAELLSYFDTEQLHEWSELEAQQDAILEAVQAYKLEQEQGIKSIRKKG